MSGKKSESKKTEKKDLPRLELAYREFRAKLQTELGLKNVHQVPHLQKIVINMGVGEAVKTVKALEAAVKDLEMITGQKAVMTKSRKSIATFKLRKGLPIGCMVTLRRRHMYEFLDRLINVAFPRIRDFKGFSPKAFDGRGNYSLGLKEQIIFPEIDYDKVDQVRGMSISFVTNASSDRECKALLEKFSFPFRQN